MVSSGTRQQAQRGDMTNAVAATPARQRLVAAAFQLFDERGYEQTTVDDITERAGLGRTTFFRHFRTKEEVVFPQHDALLADIRQRLAASSDQTALVAVTDAVRLVLLAHLAEGDRARQRYALTSQIPDLRDHEIATGATYQRLFREHISAWSGPPALTALQAELMASAVVAAHNHVLRRWLRGECADPLDEVDRAMTEVIELFTRHQTSPAAGADPPSPVSSPTAAPSSPSAVQTAVVVMTSDRPLPEVLPAIQALLAGGAPAG